MNVFITGINGFVGGHLTDYVLSKGNTNVFGIDLRESQFKNKNLPALAIKTYICNLLDKTSVTQIIKDIRPDWIFHLAAHSFVPFSWKNPAETIQANVIGTINLFEAVRDAKIRPRILVAGSSEEYGLVLKNELPVKETNPFRPLNPYAVSKISQDMLCFQYQHSYNLPIICTRAFNHVGPGQNDSFAISNFAKQISDIEKHRTEPVIMAGNLAAVRDFSDVRDIVCGYWSAMEFMTPGEAYNLCSGIGRSIQEVLDALLQLSEVKIEVKKDPNRMRPPEVPHIVGDYSKFKKATGWQPIIPFNQTLKDVLNFWRLFS